MVTALFPTISNPPTFGTILSLKYIENIYDKIFIVVRDVPLALSIDRVVTMLDKVLCQGNSKYAILINGADFTRLTTLPKELPNCDVIITDDTRTYTNLIGKGYDNILLIPRPIGWDDTFHRIAFQRSLTLERVNNGIRTIINPDEYVEKMKKEIEA